MYSFRKAVTVFDSGYVLGELELHVRAVFKVIFRECEHIRNFHEEYLIILV